MKTLSLLSCPHCNQPLAIADKSYSCVNNHCFDVSKEGYINLLPVNKKKSKSPGDNDVMIDSRRVFLEAGYYDQLADKIASSILINQSTHLNHLLDAGCGEGYYTDKVLSNIRHDDSEVIGIDISKHAVKLAAKKYRESSFVVSSIYSMPIIAEKMDLVLTVFAPILAEELARVVHDESTVVIVGPAADHLKELAEIIYDDFRPHQSKIVAKMEPFFSLAANERLTYTINVKSQDHIMDLLKMTPYYWNISKETLKQMESLESLELTCDFEILLFNKKNIASLAEDAQQ